MMTLRYPFEADSKINVDTDSGALIYKIMARKVPIISGNYSPELKKLVHQLLDFEPQNRPSVHKILENPLIKQHMSHTL